MFDRRLQTVLWLIFTSAFLAAPPASAKDEWVRVRSKNFTLVGNASEKEVRSTATRLEQFREVLSRVLNRVNVASPTPTVVAVFKTDAAYAPYKPRGANGKINERVGGYFQPGDDVNYIALPVSGADEFDTVFHEYAHFIVDNNFGRGSVPPWFNEGFAEYYQTVKIEDDRRVILGGVQNGHVRQLARNRLIPFEEFFSVNETNLHERTSDGVNLFYAQAWALFHYFQHGSGGARQNQMYKFLDLTTKNRQPKQAFAEAFQTDYATLESELNDYIARNKFFNSITTFKEKLLFDREMQSAPLAEAESLAYLGDLLLHTRRFAEAEAHLERALALDPNLAAALITLGLIKSREKKFAEAKKYLEKAVRFDAENYLAQYNYAYVLSREGMEAGEFVFDYEPEAAEKMRAALKKSIELNPNFAESYSLYAFVSHVRNERIDEALEYMRKAVALAPGNSYYAIRLAQLDARKGNYAEAKRLAQRIYDRAADEALKNYAQSALRSIEREEAQIERLKNLRSSRQNSAADDDGAPDFLIVTDKELTDEERAALNVKIWNHSINRALRKTLPGERRIIGFLVKIECGAKGIVYQFRSENRISTFMSKDFKSLYLMGFDDKSSGTNVGCNSVKREVFTLLTYRPNPATNAPVIGEVVAVEFLPEHFKLAN